MGRARPIRVLLVVLATVAGLAVGGAAPAGAAAPPAKAFTVSASPAAPVWSQAVKLSASITPKGGGAPRGGTVTFLADGVPLGTATATTRITTLTTRAIPVGTHQLTAEYAGDDSTAPGTTAPVAISVGPAPTALDLTSRVDPIASGAAAELRAVVRSVAPANTSIRPTGVVTFTAGSRTGVVPVNANGVATWRPKLADGIHAVTATYEGSDLHQPVAADGFDIQVGAERVNDLWIFQEPSNFRPLSQAPSEVRAVAQRITPRTTGWLDGLILMIYRRPTGTDPGPIRVTIQTVDAEGRPTGTVIGEGTYTVANQAPRDDFRPDLILERPARVTAGVPVALVLEAPAPGGTGTWDLGVYQGFGEDGHVLHAKVDDGDWSVDSWVDNGTYFDSTLIFATWVTPSPNR